MAVQDEDSFKRYVANGVATVYAIPFLLLSASDLQVTLDAVPVTSGFTVSGIGSNTGSITFDAAPTGDLLLQRVVPFERLTDYQDNGDLLAKTVNLDFDRLWLAMQELRRDDSTALRTSSLEPEGIPNLPLAAQRASRVLAFGPSGDPVVSNLTIDELEQQPTLAQAAADAAAAAASASSASASAASGSANASAASAYLAQKWAAEVPDTPVSGGLFSARHYAEKAAQAVQWATLPIGVPIPVWTHIPGVSEPPTDSSYRYIKLTASDAYNTGVLTSESVSGSAPLVQATAVISDVLSPLNGQTIRLINTERRSLRAGSSGTVEADSLQGHKHGPDADQNATTIWSTKVPGGAFSMSGGSTLAATTSVGIPISDGANGTPRTANETRSKNIGADYYMRIR
ncbi:hypothetical protein ACOQNP_23850 [Ectopseudomonas khazarica]|uniref:hypothetical protein n=1 Tax=Ectopseudomonas khazarica TaxID=2502979 RepID=UPI003B92D485